jgi:ubiquinone biosynthesis protein UbiJ
MQVTAERLEEMNLLGLFMKAALEERLPALERARPSGTFAVQSGGMSVTLSCSPDEVVVRKGLAGHPDATLSGELGVLAQLAGGRMVTSVLRRRIRISGNPLMLLPLARTFWESR